MEAGNGDGAKMKIIIILSILMLVFIVGCAEKQIGGEQDEHGCYLMAGYNWCESKQECVRYWEVGCGDCEFDSDCSAFGKDGECNCGCYNKEMMPTSSGGACFCAAPTLCKCIEGKCEGIF